MTGKTNPIIKTVILAIIFMLLGAVIGFASKWLDLNNEFFGNLFSRIMIWFLLCTAIAVYSKKPINAAVNVFTFCIGMLTAYYLTAIWWDAVWGKTFMYGWAAFSLCSPFFAFLSIHSSRSNQGQWEMVRLRVYECGKLRRLKLNKISIKIPTGCGSLTLNLATTSGGYLLNLAL